MPSDPPPPDSPGNSPTPDPSPIPTPPEGTGATPPPIPSPPSDRLSEQILEMQRKRLHPLSLLFVLVNLVKQFIIPVGIVLLLGRESFIGGFIFLFLLIPLLVSVVRYYTFTYRVEGGELITREGLLSRRERNIPLTRVQDIRVEQGIMHRLMGMADVHVDTASGGSAEASLSVLAKAEADRFRSAVFACKHAHHRTGDTAEFGEPDLGLGEEHNVPLREVSLRELVLAGMTSNHLATAAAILAVAWGFLDDLMPKETYEGWVKSVFQVAETWFDQGGIFTWLVVAAGLVALFLVGMVFSVGGSIVLFYGFTLSLAGEDLNRTYGLFTRRSSSLPRRRIQVLKIEEKLMRRLFKLATLRADIAGHSLSQSGGSKSGRDVLLPVVKRHDVETLLPSIFPDLNTAEHPWHRVSRVAIRRGTYKGLVVCLIWALVLVLIRRDLVGLWPLGLVPLIYVLNVMSYRHLGYWLGKRYFQTRRGWLSRSGHVVPIRNTQVMVVRQSPFDRRHGVSTLHVDTAGQAYTGGGPQISNVPAEEAESLAWTLARKAAATGYRW